MKSPPPAEVRYFENLRVEIHPTRRAAGEAAARSFASHLRKMILAQEQARVIFACAPSQNEFLAALRQPVAGVPRIDWQKVTAFHMDEYVGIHGSDPRSFRSYLKQHLLDHVSIKSFHPICGEDPDPAGFCRRYAILLNELPIDVICLGIGENGHLAFNDPPVALFDDKEQVKSVVLDPDCRRQQVNDGCFPTLDAVPTAALTLTLPVFSQARRLYVQVPGPRKAKAVQRALEGPISTACPASMLRQHPSATLYLDPDSSRLIKRKT